MSAMQPLVPALMLVHIRLVLTAMSAAVSHTYATHQSFKGMYAHFLALQETTSLVFLIYFFMTFPNYPPTIVWSASL